MIEKDARCYFANLLGDVSRCVRAARDGNDERYRDSLARGLRSITLTLRTMYTVYTSLTCAYEMI